MKPTRSTRSARLMKTALCISVSLLLCIETETHAAQYSKRGIVAASKQAGKWDALKAWIAQAGYADEWLAAAFFSDGYPAFSAITNAVISQGVATEEEVRSILAAATDTAPDALLGNVYAADMRTDAGRARWHGGQPTHHWVTNEAERAVYRIDRYPDGWEYRVPGRTRIHTPDELAAAAANRLGRAERRRRFYEGLVAKRDGLAAKVAAYEAEPAASNRLDYARWVIELQQASRAIEIYEHSLTNTVNVNVGPRGN